MNSRMAFCGAALIAGLLGFSIQAAAQSRFIVGVCSHELHRGHGSHRPHMMMRDAGISSVRTDAHWAFVERARDKLKIESHWPRYLNATEQHGLNTMFILGYGNSFHDNGSKPRTEAHRQAFGRYVDHVSQEMRGRVEFYEVWNEWDVEDPRDPAFSDDYGRLVEHSARIIRARDPQAKVLAGAVTTLGIESGFARRLVANGVLEDVDGLSLHPYVHCRSWGRNTPEAWIEWMAEVDADLSRAAGRPVPLYLTEMAWPANRGACGISETLQAAYLVRSFFLARTLPNIKGMWWYNFQNDGTDPAEREHNFGLVKHNLAPKLAYQTLAAISDIVSRYDFVGRLEHADEDAVLLRFDKDDEQLLVAWSGGEPLQIDIQASASQLGHLQLIDTAQPDRRRFTSGTAWQCGASDAPCSARIGLDGFPKIISLNASRR